MYQDVGKKTRLIPRSGQPAMPRSMGLSVWGSFAARAQGEAEF
jgi:hypothetical protein